MPKETFDIGLNATWGQTFDGAAADANVLTTGRAAINFRKGFNAVLFSIDADGARVAFSPAIRAVYQYDASRSGANRWRDLILESKAILDSAQTGISVVEALATADFLYVGVTDRIGGVRFNIDASILNNNAATLTLQHNGNGEWTALTVGSDGTASGGAPFAITGNITWTAPVAALWSPRTLKDMGDPSAPDTEPLYWVRIITDAVLDNVEIEQIASLNHSFLASASGTAAGAAMFMKESSEYNFNLNKDTVGAFEYCSQHATNAATIELSWLRRG